MWLRDLAGGTGTRRDGVAAGIPLGRAREGRSVRWEAAAACQRSVFCNRSSLYFSSARV